MHGQPHIRFTVNSVNNFTLSQQASIITYTAPLWCCNNLCLWLYHLQYNWITIQMNSLSQDCALSASQLKHRSLEKKNNYIRQISLNGKINTNMHNYISIHTHTHTSVSTWMPNRRRILTNVSCLARQTNIRSAHYAWYFSSLYDTCSTITLHPIQTFYISIPNVSAEKNATCIHIV
jgi:hypothetical protein